MKVRLSALCVLSLFVCAAMLGQEPPASVTLHANAGVEFDEGEGLGSNTLIVDLDAALPSTVHILIESIGGTATPNVDYVPVSTLLEFAPGETRKFVSVAARGDNIPEDHETIILRASQEGVERARATQTIVDNDQLPNADAPANVNIVETDDGTSLMLDIQLDRRPKLRVEFAYALVNDSATGGEDFVAHSGTIVIPAGSTTEPTIYIEILGDGDIEPNERFSLVLSDPENVVLRRNRTVITIENDDFAEPPPPLFAIKTASSGEGDAGPRPIEFEVELLAARTTTTVVTLQTTGNGSAKPGTDYEPLTETLTFAPGETVQPAEATILGDTLDEQDETFEVVVIEDGVEVASGLIRILDDDGDQPFLSIGDVEVRETDELTYAVFPVTLSKPGGVVRVSYRTIAGTATLWDDHSRATGELLFTPGDTTRTISMAIFGDVLREGAETFQIELYNARGAKLADPIATGTIVDDEIAKRRSARH